MKGELAPAACRIRVGGLGIDLRCEDATLAKQVCSTVGIGTMPLEGGHGAEHPRPDLTLYLRVVETPWPHIYPPQLRMRPGPGEWIALSHSEARVAWSESAGWGIAQLQPGRAAVQAMLQLLVCTLLPRRGGLALHAASLVHKGRAYLFPGASGVGKTTLVRFSGGSPALGDDVSMVARQQEETAFHAFPSPFWSQGRRPPEDTRRASPQGYPLARICFLEKSEQPWRRAVNPGEAMDLLLEHTMVTGPDVLQAALILDIALPLVQGVPSERIGVPYGRPVWPWLVPEDKQ